MDKELTDILRRGFFDYMVMLSEIRKPEETAAAVRVLNDIMMLFESTRYGDIQFVNDVVEDIQSMIGIACQEAGQYGQGRLLDSRNEILAAEKRYQMAEKHCRIAQMGYQQYK